MQDCSFVPVPYPVFPMQLTLLFPPPLPFTAMARYHPGPITYHWVKAVSLSSVPTAYPIFPSKAYFSTLNIETACSPTISVTVYWSAQCHISEDNILQSLTWESPAQLQHWYFKTGASHLDDTAYTIEYAFKTNETDEDREMSNLLLDIWTSFAANG